MKKLLKQVGWLIAIIVGVAFMALIFTAIFQTAMEFFADRNGVVLSESVLYGISGTLGCGFAAIAICVIIRYAKRLRFYDCANPADSKWIAAFIVFTFAVCRIVLPGIWAYASSALGVQAAPVGNAPEESMWQMILFGVILSPRIGRTIVSQRYILSAENAFFALLDRLVVGPSFRRSPRLQC